MGKPEAMNDYSRCRWPTCNCYAPGAPPHCIRDEAKRQYQAFVDRINRTTDREIDAVLSSSPHRSIDRSGG